MDGKLLFISALSYLSIFVWVTIDIYDGVDPLPMDGYSRSQSAWQPLLQIGFGLPIFGFLLACGSFFLFLLLIVIWPTKFAIDEVLGRCTGRNIGIVLSLLGRFLLLASFSIVSLCFPDLKALLRMSLIPWIFLIGLGLPGFLVWRFLQTRAESWPRFSRGVFISWESEMEKRAMGRSVDEDYTFVCFAVFLYTKILCTI